MSKRSLRETQSIFAKNFAKLILYAYDLGYEVTLGEVLRPDEMQEIYFKKGLSKVKTAGPHGQKRAGDINLFIDGKYRTDREAYKLLAEYWKKLNPDNVAGYDWGWDANHFEMKL